MFTYSSGDTEIELCTLGLYGVSSLYLANNMHLLHLDQRGRSSGVSKVLELGAGAGCPGILIAGIYDHKQGMGEQFSISKHALPAFRDHRGADGVLGNMICPWW